LDLSRLVLGQPVDTSPSSAPETPAFEVTEAESTTIALRVPETIADALHRLDSAVAKDEQISWSADYFKYRVFGALPLPFSFSDVMRKAESVFEDPPYGEIKEIIFDLLGKGGCPAIISQKFDLNIDADTREASGRKEIVFGTKA
jgi:hypothetical protein